MAQGPASREQYASQGARVSAILPRVRISDILNPSERLALGSDTFQDKKTYAQRLCDRLADAGLVKPEGRDEDTSAIEKFEEWLRSYLFELAEERGHQKRALEARHAYLGDKLARLQHQITVGLDAELDTTKQALRDEEKNYQEALKRLEGELKIAKKNRDKKQSAALDAEKKLLKQQLGAVSKRQKYAEDKTQYRKKGLRLEKKQFEASQRAITEQQRKIETQKNTLSRMAEKVRSRFCSGGRPIIPEVVLKNISARELEDFDHFCALQMVQYLARDHVVSYALALQTLSRDLVNVSWRNRRPCVDVRQKLSELRVVIIDQLKGFNKSISEIFSPSTTLQRDQATFNRLVDFFINGEHGEHGELKELLDAFNSCKNELQDSDFKLKFQRLWNNILGEIQRAYEPIVTIATEARDRTSGRVHRALRDFVNTNAREGSSEETALGFMTKAEALFARGDRLILPLDDTLLREQLAAGLKDDASESASRESVPSALSGDQSSEKKSSFPQAKVERLRKNLTRVQKDPMTVLQPAEVGTVDVGLQQREVIKFCADPHNAVLPPVSEQASAEQRFIDKAYTCFRNYVSQGEHDASLEKTAITEMKSRVSGLTPLLGATRNLQELELEVAKFVQDWTERMSPWVGRLVPLANGLIDCLGKWVDADKKDEHKHQEKFVNELKRLLEALGLSFPSEPDLLKKIKTLRPLFKNGFGPELRDALKDWLAEVNVLIQLAANGRISSEVLFQRWSDMPEALRREFDIKRKDLGPLDSMRLAYCYFVFGNIGSYISALLSEFPESVSLPFFEEFRQWYDYERMAEQIRPVLFDPDLDYPFEYLLKVDDSALASGGENPEDSVGVRARDQKQTTLRSLLALRFAPPFCEEADDLSELDMESMSVPLQRRCAQHPLLPFFYASSKKRDFEVSRRFCQRIQNVSNPEAQNPSEFDNDPVVYLEQSRMEQAIQAVTQPLAFLSAKTIDIEENCYQCLYNFITDAGRTYKMQHPRASKALLLRMLAVSEPDPSTIEGKVRMLFDAAMAGNIHKAAALSQELQHVKTRKVRNALKELLRPDLFERVLETSDASPEVQAMLQRVKVVFSNIQQVQATGTGFVSQYELQLSDDALAQHANAAEINAWTQHRLETLLSMSSSLLLLLKQANGIGFLLSKESVLTPTKSGWKCFVQTEDGELNIPSVREARYILQQADTFLRNLEVERRYLPPELRQNLAAIQEDFLALNRHLNKTRIGEKTFIDNYSTLFFDDNAQYPIGKNPKNIEHFDQFVESFLPANSEHYHAAMRFSSFMKGELLPQDGTELKELIRLVADHFYSADISLRDRVAKARALISQTAENVLIPQTNYENYHHSPESINRMDSMLVQLVQNGRVSQQEYLWFSEAFGKVDRTDSDAAADYLREKGITPEEDALDEQAMTDGGERLFGLGYVELRRISYLAKANSPHEVFKYFVRDDSALSEDEKSQVERWHHTYDGGRKGFFRVSDSVRLADGKPYTDLDLTWRRALEKEVNDALEALTHLGDRSSYSVEEIKEWAYYLLGNPMYQQHVKAVLKNTKPAQDMTKEEFQNLRLVMNILADVWDDQALSDMLAQRQQKMTNPLSIYAYHQLATEHDQTLARIGTWEKRLAIIADLRKAARAQEIGPEARRQFFEPTDVVIYDFGPLEDASDEELGFYQEYLAGLGLKQKELEDKSGKDAKQKGRDLLKERVDFLKARHQSSEYQAQLMLTGRELDDLYNQAVVRLNKLKDQYFDEEHRLRTPPIGMSVIPADETFQTLRVGRVQIIPERVPDVSRDVSEDLLEQQAAFEAEYDKLSQQVKIVKQKRLKFDGASEKTEERVELVDPRQIARFRELTQDLIRIDVELSQQRLDLDPQKLRAPFARQRADLVSAKVEQYEQLFSEVAALDHKIENLRIELQKNPSDAHQQAVYKRSSQELAEKRLKLEALDRAMRSYQFVDDPMTLSHRWEFLKDMMLNLAKLLYVQFGEPILSYAILEPRLAEHLTADEQNIFKSDLLQADRAKVKDVLKAKSTLDNSDSTQEEKDAAQLLLQKQARLVHPLRQWLDEIYLAMDFLAVRMPIGERFREYMMTSKVQRSVSTQDFQDLEGLSHMMYSLADERSGDPKESRAWLARLVSGGLDCYRKLSKSSSRKEEHLFQQSKDFFAEQPIAHEGFDRDRSDRLTALTAKIAANEYFIPSDDAEKRLIEMWADDVVKEEIRYRRIRQALEQYTEYTREAPVIVGELRAMMLAESGDALFNDPIIERKLSNLLQAHITVYGWSPAITLLVDQLAENDPNRLWDQKRILFQQGLTRALCELKQIHAVSIVGENSGSLDKGFLADFTHYLKQFRDEIDGEAFQNIAFAIFSQFLQDESPFNAENMYNFGHLLTQSDDETRDLFGQLQSLKDVLPAGIVRKIQPLCQDVVARHVIQAKDELIIDSMPVVFHDSERSAIMNAVVKEYVETEHEAAEEISEMADSLVTPRFGFLKSVHDHPRFSANASDVFQDQFLRGPLIDMRDPDLLSSRIGFNAADSADYLLDFRSRQDFFDLTKDPLSEVPRDQLPDDLRSSYDRCQKKMALLPPHKHPELLHIINRFLLDLLQSNYPDTLKRFLAQPDALPSVSSLGKEDRKRVEGVVLALPVQKLRILDNLFFQLEKHRFHNAEKDPIVAGVMDLHEEIHQYLLWKDMVDYALNLAEPRRPWATYDAEIFRAIVEDINLTIKASSYTFRKARSETVLFKRQHAYMQAAVLRHLQLLQSDVNDVTQESLLYEMMGFVSEESECEAHYYGGDRRLFGEAVLSDCHRYDEEQGHRRIVIRWITLGESLDESFDFDQWPVSDSFVFEGKLFSVVNSLGPLTGDRNLIDRIEANIESLSRYRSNPFIAAVIHYSSTILNALRLRAELHPTEQGDDASSEDQIRAILQRNIDETFLANYRSIYELHNVFSDCENGVISELPSDGKIVVWQENSSWTEAQYHPYWTGRLAQLLKNKPHDLMALKFCIQLFGIDGLIQRLSREQLATLIRDNVNNPDYLKFLFAEFPASLMVKEREINPQAWFVETVYDALFMTPEPHLLEGKSDSARFQTVLGYLKEMPPDILARLTDQLRQDYIQRLASVSQLIEDRSLTQDGLENLSEQIKVLQDYYFNFKQLLPSELIDDGKQLQPKEIADQIRNRFETVMSGLTDSGKRWVRVFDFSDDQMVDNYISWVKTVSSFYVFITQTPDALVEQLQPCVLNQTRRIDDLGQEIDVLSDDSPIEAQARQLRNLYRFVTNVVPQILAMPEGAKIKATIHTAHGRLSQQITQGFARSHLPDVSVSSKQINCLRNAKTILNEIIPVHIEDRKTDELEVTPEYEDLVSLLRTSDRSSQFSELFDRRAHWVSKPIRQLCMAACESDSESLNSWFQSPNLRQFLLLYGPGRARDFFQFVINLDRRCEGASSMERRSKKKSSLIEVDDAVKNALSKLSDFSTVLMSGKDEAQAMSALMQEDDLSYAEEKKTRFKEEIFALVDRYFQDDKWNVYIESFKCLLNAVFSKDEQEEELSEDEQEEELLEGRQKEVPVSDEEVSVKKMAMVFQAIMIENTLPLSTDLERYAACLQTTTLSAQDSSAELSLSDFLFGLISLWRREQNEKEKSEDQEKQAQEAQDVLIESIFTRCLVMCNLNIRAASVESRLYEMKRYEKYDELKKWIVDMDLQYVMSADDHFVELNQEFQDYRSGLKPPCANLLDFTLAYFLFPSDLQETKGRGVWADLSPQSLLDFHAPASTGLEVLRKIDCLKRQAEEQGLAGFGLRETALCTHIPALRLYVSRAREFLQAYYIRCLQGNGEMTSMSDPEMMQKLEKAYLIVSNFGPAGAKKEVDSLARQVYLMRRYTFSEKTAGNQVTTLVKCSLDALDYHNTGPGGVIGQAWSYLMTQIQGLESFRFESAIAYLSLRLFCKDQKLAFDAIMRKPEHAQEFKQIHAFFIELGSTQQTLLSQFYILYSSANSILRDLILLQKGYNQALALNVSQCLAAMFKNSAGMYEENPFSPNPLALFAELLNAVDAAYDQDRMTTSGCSEDEEGISHHATVVKSSFFQTDSQESLCSGGIKISWRDKVSEAMKEASPKISAESLLDQCPDIGSLLAVKTELVSSIYEALNQLSADKLMELWLLGRHGMIIARMNVIQHRLDVLNAFSPIDFKVVPLPFQQDIVKKYDEELALKERLQTLIDMFAVIHEILPRNVVLPEEMQSSLEGMARFIGVHIAKGVTITPEAFWHRIIKVMHILIFTKFRPKVDGGAISEKNILEATTPVSSSLKNIFGRPDLLLQLANDLYHQHGVFSFRDFYDGYLNPQNLKKTKKEYSKAHQDIRCDKADQLIKKSQYADILLDKHSEIMYPACEPQSWDKATSKGYLVAVLHTLMRCIDIQEQQSLTKTVLDSILTPFFSSFSSGDKDDNDAYDEALNIVFQVDEALKCVGPYIDQFKKLHELIFNLKEDAKESRNVPTLREKSSFMGSEKSTEGESFDIGPIAKVVQECVELSTPESPMPRIVRVVMHAMVQTLERAEQEWQEASLVEALKKLRGCLPVNERSPEPTAPPSPDVLSGCSTGDGSKSRDGSESSRSSPYSSSDDLPGDGLHL